MTYYSAPGIIFNRTPDEIIEMVSRIMGVPIEDIKSKRRFRGMVTARQVCTYLIKTKYPYKYSLSEINIMVGGTGDHALSINSLKSVNNLMETEPTFKKMIQDLSNKLEIN